MPFIDLVDVGGDFEAPAPLEGRFVQLALSLRGDGTDTPRVAGLRVLGGPCLCPDGEPSCPAPRETEGLVALYELDGEGGVVADAIDPPLSLSAPAEDTRRGDGTLRLVDGAVASATPATKVTEACRASNALTVEAWIEPPGDLPEDAPARIVTLSKDSSKRSFTLGQAADGSFVFRLHTSETSDNGLPPLVSPSNLARPGIMHVAYTRDATGEAALYVDGEPVRIENVPGTLDIWDPSHGFALGNELGGGRAWNGVYHLVAVYDRALSAATVARHRALGP
jgi:hypothetical protein